MAGVDVFSLQPLAVDRMGTLHDPIKVPSVFDERMIGCAGFPIDSHDLLWYKSAPDSLPSLNTGFERPLISLPYFLKQRQGR